MAKYLKIPAWAHFWNFDRQLRLFFTQITGASSYKLVKNCVLFLCVVSFIDLVSLITLDLTAFTRHLLSDPCLFFGLSPSVNWIFLLFAGDNAAFHLRMYRPAGEVQWLIREILFGKSLARKKVKNFACKHSGIGQNNGKTSSSVELVRVYVGKYLLIMQYFIYVAVVLLLFCKGISLYLIALDWRFFFTSISGYASMSLIFLSSFIFDLSVITYGNSHAISSTACIAFTLVAFIQLGKANGILQKSPPTSANLRRFIYLHTQMLALIFKFNAFYGQLLTAYIIIQLPSNSYLLLRLLLGHFNPATGLIFLNFICIQFIAIFVFHALGASFSSRIHACKRRLFAQQQANLPLADKLKVDSYLMKFNTKKKYGITYGSIGLMTFASFSKFLLFYGEIIMNWFTLVAKK